MFRNLVASALFAGLAAGLIVAALRLIFVVPVILEAELYETGVKTHFAGVEHPQELETTAGTEAEPALDHAAAIEEQGSLLSRDVLTVLATIATQIGFALLLVAGYSFAENAGYTLSPRTGLLWGLGGFLAFQLLPAAGLPPELPGVASAALQGRQLWWIITVALSATGIGLIAFSKSWPVWLAGVAAILAPHLIGAPQPAEFAGVVPPELASDFIGKTMVVNAAGWALLGLFAAWFSQKKID